MFFFQNVNQEVVLETNLRNGKKYICIPHSFLVINFCIQGKTSCLPCTFMANLCHLQQYKAPRFPRCCFEKNIVCLWPTIGVLVG
jgi:hypothetical protein